MVMSEFRYEFKCVVCGADFESVAGLGMIIKGDVADFLETSPGCFRKGECQIHLCRKCGANLRDNAEVAMRESEAV